MNILNQTAIAELSRPSILNETQDKYIAVIQFKDGKFGVIQATNAARVIACTNTPGCNDYYPDGYSVDKIHGVKEVTEERTLETVTKKFQDIAGKDNVYSMAVA